MKLVLDTSFLIELKKGNELARRVLEERKKDCEDLMISAISIYELLAGAYYIWKRYGNAREMIIINEMLKSLTINPLDSSAAKRSAEVRAELMLKGIVVPDIDIMIACSIDEKSGEILTFDEDLLKLREIGFKVTIPK
ncbi:MAG: type II toxin-antitoxin system VapC family toxin [Candidatus Nitrosocaldus sp.]|nr:type II toxin-antitoxin system VapC family toxin [Candidatus Nitrosocaldus sp.]